MVLDSLDIRGRGASFPPLGPVGPSRPAIGPVVPMTGPGARPTVRDRPPGGGIFGGSLLPTNDIEPTARPDTRRKAARGVVVLLPALNEEKGVGDVIERTPK